MRSHSNRAPPSSQKIASLAFTLVVASGCASTGGPGVEAPTTSDSHSGERVPPELWPAPFRLPAEATPLAYDLHLQIDPASERFSGSIRIDFELDRPTRLVRLHAHELTVTSATYRRESARPEDLIPLEAHLDGAGALALTSGTALPAGPGLLELHWHGPLAEPPVGLYRAKDGAHHYAFTQFEPLEARRAFPSFDEPRFKTPWTVTLTVPEGSTALSNMPVATPPATPEAATAHPGPVPAGFLRTHFQTSPPMPTYLVAFAVGPFDIVEGPPVSSRKVPFRVVTTKGKGHLARFAIERTPAHLDLIERYFDIPYPYPKLDFVAVPSFSSSAMENVGLVTYREAVLLIDAQSAPLGDRLRGESIISHELAHMWFGNLVTLAWWDDLWLNEAFAVWMSRKGVSALAPEFELRDQIVRGKFHVMWGDSRPASRAIREPIATDGDIYNAFDGITYSKGASVLEMIESWIGPEAFRAGVRNYLLAHAHGIATTADLLHHLEAAALSDREPTRPHRVAPGELGRIMASFTDQAQVPLVSLDWSCTSDGRVSLQLAQREWRSLADPRGALADDGRLWTIPVCALLSDGKRQQTHCGLLDTRRATWPTPLSFCPTFSHPNVDEAGYYRWETRLGPVSIARQEPLVFAGYVANLRASVDEGRLPVPRFLDLVEPLVSPSLSPSALGDILSALSIVPGFYPEAANDPRFRARAKRWLGAMPVDLELGADLRSRRIQPMLVRTYADLGDKGVLARAERETRRFLTTLAKGSPHEADFQLERTHVYLPMHIRSLGHGPKTRARRDTLWRALERGLDSPHPGVRTLVIHALGAFDDPELAVRSLSLVTERRLRAQDFRTVRAWIPSRPAVVEAVWGWLTTHFEALVDKLGSKAAPSLPQLAGGFCDPERADEVEKWFADKSELNPSGLSRQLALVVDQIRACAVARAHHGPSARAWYAGAPRGAGERPSK